MQLFKLTRVIKEDMHCGMQGIHRRNMRMHFSKGNAVGMQMYVEGNCVTSNLYKTGGGALNITIDDSTGHNKEQTIDDKEQLPGFELPRLNQVIYL